MQEATVPLTDIEYSYGFGVYETIQIRNGNPLFLGDHLIRLMQSASLLGIKHTLETSKIAKWIESLCENIGNDRYNIKILLIGAKEAKDVTLSIIPLQPRFPDKRWYKNGVETITVEFERPIPAAKTLNMLRSYLAQRDATEHECYEALSIHNDDCIYEGTRSNFFAVKGNSIITPPTDTILEGVTRKYVLKLAEENGIDVIEERIPKSEIQKYDGAFLTSSSTKVMPIIKIDTYEFAEIPETTKRLISLYDELLRK